MNDKLTIKIWIIFSILANHFRFKARLSAFAFGVFWRAALCVHQDICCIRGAARGRVLPAKERGQSGRKGHAHHSQTRPHVPPPPLGAQRWRPLHRRERQTCARHTQVIKHGIMHIISLHKTPTHIMFGVNTDMGSSWSFLPSQHSSHSVYKTTCVAFFCLFVFFTHNILLFFFASHSHFPSSHAWSCSCVSRAMFPETEQQTVSQMMATESNYRPAVLQCMVMRFWLSFPLAQMC